MLQILKGKGLIKHAFFCILSVYNFRSLFSHVQVFESVPSPCNDSLLAEVSHDEAKIIWASCLSVVFFLISALILVLQKAVIYIGSNNYALVIR